MHQSVGIWVLSRLIYNFGKIKIMILYITNQSFLVVLILYQDANTSFWIAWNRVTNQRKDCNIPCHSATVSLGAKNYQNKTGEQDYGLLYLYYAPRVTQSIEHLLYTILNLFAEIGGYVGLILGYSLFHVAALISGAIETKVKRMEEENKIRIKTYSAKEDGRQSSWSGENPKT